MEFTATALLPCEHHYRIPDQFGGTGLPGYLRTIGESIFTAPSIIVFAPFRLTRELLDLAITSIGRLLADMHWIRGYDYGAQTSIREHAQAKKPENQPQMQDVVKYTRILERRVLACLIDFLETRHVDTSELQQRVEMVLNAGVINAGVVNTGTGTVNATSAAGTMTSTNASI